VTKAEGAPKEGEGGTTRDRPEVTRAETQDTRSQRVRLRTTGSDVQARLLSHGSAQAQATAYWEKSVNYDIL